MDWPIDSILKFIDLYRQQECIWLPSHRYYKDRKSHNEAWLEIKDQMDIECTVAELKKKKESLMASYRSVKTKMRRAELNGEGFSTSWFAFSAIDDFLGSVYKPNLTSENEGENDCNESSGIIEALDSFCEDENSHDDAPVRAVTTEKRKPPQGTSKVRPQIVVKKKRNASHDPLETELIEYNMNYKSDTEECELFGQLVASKLRRLSQDGRDLMMFKINEIMFSTIAQKRKKSQCSTTIRSSGMKLEADFTDSE